MTARFVSFAMATLFASSALAEVTVKDAYVRSTGTSAAVYFQLENNGAEERLLSVTTKAAEMAELHSSTETADGVMQMQEMGDEVVIPANGTLAFSQGGNHVMLMGLAQKLKNGDIVTLTLTFAGQGPLEVTAPVDNARKAQGHDHTKAPAVSE